MIAGVWYVCNMAKKKNNDNNYTYDLNAIFGKGSEEKRMADKVLDRLGVSNDYKHQYVAEKNMKAESKKNLAAKSRQEILKERRATAQERLKGK